MNWFDAAVSGLLSNRTGRIINTVDASWGSVIIAAFPDKVTHYKSVLRRFATLSFADYAAALGRVDTL
jgi:hypothetical protein